MYKTTVTSQGTISIPAVLRNKYALKAGDKLIIEDQGKIILSKAVDFTDLQKVNQAKINKNKANINQHKNYKSADVWSSYAIEKYGKKNH